MLARAGVILKRAAVLSYAVMPLEESKVITASSVSARIIAMGIVVAFCYFASTVLVTLLMAVLLAYFLDPVVTWLEQARIPRALGSLLMVLFTLALLAVVGWSLVERADQFSTDWPKYRAPLRAASADFDRRLASLEARVSEIEPGQAQGSRVIDGHRSASGADGACRKAEFALLLSVCRDVHAFSGFFHARGEAPGVARHHAAFSGDGAHRSERCARGRHAECCAAI